MQEECQFQYYDKDKRLNKDDRKPNNRIFSSKCLYLLQKIK